MTGSVTHFEIYAEGPARPVGLHRGLFGWQLDEACRPRRNAGVQTPRNGCRNAPLRASRGLARRGAITLRAAWDGWFAPTPTPPTLDNAYAVVTLGP